jgi:hypothetical protein
MKSEYNGRQVNLPDFLIVGANKGGTTSLYHYLKQHPRIYMPMAKEPNFFLFGDSPPEKINRRFAVFWQWKNYLDLFKDAADGQVIGEASTPYLTHYEKVIPAIKKFVPHWRDVKIIMVLRNPAERAYSNYLMFRNWGLEKRTAGEALDPDRARNEGYLKAGFYYPQVKAYIDNFRHVRVYLLEDLRKDPQGAVKDLFRFLGVDPTFTPDTSTKYNPSGEPRSGSLHKLINTPGIIGSKLPFLKLIPLETRVRWTAQLAGLNLRKKKDMDPSLRKRLQDMYREDILKLQALIGRDLSRWIQ